MPADDLEKIKPLSTSSAEYIYSSQPVLSGKPQILECKEPPIGFLKSNLGHGAIYIVWSPKLAVETTTDIFIKYFDDFCYPSSDDISIWPASNSWLLQYHHYEALSFVA